MGGCLELSKENPLIRKCLRQSILSHLPAVMLSPKTSHPLYFSAAGRNFVDQLTFIHYTSDRPSIRKNANRNLRPNVKTKTPSRRKQKSTQYSS